MQTIISCWVGTHPTNHPTEPSAISRQVSAKNKKPSAKTKIKTPFLLDMNGTTSYILTQSDDGGK